MGTMVIMAIMIFRKEGENQDKWDRQDRQIWHLNLTFQITCDVFFHFHSNDSGEVAMLVRKQSENPEDYFNKDFKEYQDGFAANGKM